ncbi:multiple sugar transport system permease protein [Actinoalloteichus hoggarensis]|uniref:Trehalose transport system permease protein SugB n=1 Tax=Actinoalloteichus hoggarensis TaxID=1470176 RepID=A0A221W8F9_9PSEU|nr:carbohydrate ABC transporter permease [Actinoalloteichus hoggarensis]ASO21961.1 Trehalose transport system permease protein SugB [Actinoalloteichus hoggarensis]MBB5923959.1 multiple sugar transport system permease protein [Actinoalloteichus hoggarensis]
MSTATLTAPEDQAATPPPKRNKKPGRLRTVLWHAVILAFIAVLLYPIAWLLGAAFKPANEVITSLALLPENPTWQNFVDAVAGIGGTSFGTFLYNSLFIAGGSVVGNVVSCVLAAYAFARLRFKLSKLMFGFMLMTLMLPHHVVLIPQYIIFQNMGMVDTFWPLILPKFLATEAFFVFLMIQFMRGLPRELDEAATIDGCGPLRLFYYIILPLARPALITTAIFTFIWTWNDFFSQLIYLSSPSNYTLPLALRLFIDQTSVSAYGPMFAMSVLTLVPIGLFFFAFQRYLVQGLATSGLKG